MIKLDDIVDTSELVYFTWVEFLFSSTEMELSLG